MCILRGPISFINCVDEDLTPEENERRFRALLEWIHNLTRKDLIDLMGEDWLEEYRRQFP